MTLSTNRVPVAPPGKTAGTEPAGGGSAKSTGPVPLGPVGPVSGTRESSSPPPPSSFVATHSRMRNPSAPAPSSTQARIAPERLGMRLAPGRGGVLRSGLRRGEVEDLDIRRR